MLHAVLERQLRRTGLSIQKPPATPDEWKALLDRITSAYNEADGNRYLLARSLEISSREMQRLHARLAAERDRLDAILYSLGEGLCAIDNAGLVVLINPKAREHLCIEATAPLSGHYRSYFRLHDPGLSGPEVIIQSGQVRSACDATIVSCSGVSRPVSYSINPFLADGELAGAVLSFRDISSSRRTEQVLLQREQHLRLFVEHAPAAIAMFDLEMRYISVSRRWHTDYRLGDQSLIGRSHYEVFPEIPERWKEIHRRCLAGACEECEQDRFDRKNGEVDWLRWKVLPWRGVDNSVQGIVMFTELITERVKNREALVNAKLAAETASRAKSEFLANMSHEIRTPLGAILGFADLLADETLSTAARGEYIQTIRRSGDHLLSLINDILDLTKVEASELQIEHISFSPEQIIADVADLMRKRASEKSLAFAVDYRTAIPRTICTDPTRLRQILVNLIGNAIKFTTQGGVQLAVSVATATTPNSEAVGSVLRFEVIDTGIGMTANQIDKLFRPFSQADSSTTRKFGGTGLGLSVSVRLAALLQGAIRVTSALGSGSTFTLDLAVQPAECDSLVVPTENARQVASKSPNGDSRNHGAAQPLAGMSVLLAEDGPDNQRLISHYLKKAGAAVTIAENGRVAYASALEAVAAGRPFQIILMDMQMPEMDGYTATRELRNCGYAGPIVALTAHAMAEDRSRCMEAGCNDYATKPVNVPNLFKIIRSLIESGKRSDGDQSVSRSMQQSASPT